MNGNFGFLKTKKLKDKETKRTCMNEEDFALSKSDLNNMITITNTMIKQEELIDFKSRKEMIQKIIAEMVKQEKFTVNLNLEKVEVSTENLERLLIELIPRLKELGGHLVITNNHILNSTFLSEQGI